MKRSAIVAITLSALALGACASGGTFSHSKAGVTSPQIHADIQDSTAASEAAMKTVASGGTANNPALASQGGAAFGAGFAEGLAKGKARNDAYNSCMAERNYLRVALKPEELSAFRALKTLEDRKDWIATFGAQDHQSRAVPVEAPAVCKPNALVRCAT